LFKRRVDKGVGMIRTKKTTTDNVALRDRTIVGLSSQQIDLKQILDNREIIWLFYEGYEERALKNALYRAEKYLLKRKIDDKSPLGKELSERIVETAGCRSLVDEALSTVLGHFGVLSVDQMTYRTFAYKIMRIVKDYHILEWESRILDALDDWKRKHKVDEKVLHAVALATAKVTAEYYHGSRWRGMRFMRLPKPVEGEAKIPVEKNVVVEGGVERSGST
jgi:hypothetical protein